MGRAVLVIGVKLQLESFRHLERHSGSADRREMEKDRIGESLRERASDKESRKEKRPQEFLLATFAFP